MLIYQGSFTVFSTYVEVIPQNAGYKVDPNGVLHICGGDPDDKDNHTEVAQCSPHMWR